MKNQEEIEKRIKILELNIPNIKSSSKNLEQKVI